MTKENKKIKINNFYISYNLKKRNQNGPKLSVVFLNGFRSDMNGKKAKFIDLLRKKIGFEYLRFDYSGHGISEGNIDTQTISSWVNESKYLIENKTNYSTILIGSSMGGWISLILGTQLKKKINGIIGISVAADFTKFILERLTSKQKAFYKKNNYLAVASEYSNKKYIFTKKFFKDGKSNFILKKNNPIKARLYLLYGTKDSSVDLNVQLQILKKIKTKETKLFISKGSDHRMSSKEDLDMLKTLLLKMIKYNL